MGKGSFSYLYVLQVPIDNLRAMCRQIDEGKRFEEQIAKKKFMGGPDQGFELH